MFNADGALGGTVQKLGGPFDKEGVIGEKFKADGGYRRNGAEEFGRKERGALTNSNWVA